MIEVGSGDGRSFEHYPPGVERLLAVEPDATARVAAANRALDAVIPIEVVDGTAETLPAEDGAFDAAVLMGVLCSVHDPAAALGELRRVLKPGGELRFWEHVRSGNAAFRALQHATDSLFWTKALGGLGETTRDTMAAIRAAGFEIVTLERGFHSSSLVTITSAPYILGAGARRRSPTARPLGVMRRRATRHRRRVANEGRPRTLAAAARLAGAGCLGVIAALALGSCGGGGGEALGTGAVTRSIPTTLSTPARTAARRAAGDDHRDRGGDGDGDRARSGRDRNGTRDDGARRAGCDGDA